MHQSITLNLRHDLPEDAWRKIGEVYRSMDGWLQVDEGPSWYGTSQSPKYIWASVEPGGILFEGEMDSALWTGWFTVLCAKLTLALGREVHDAEM